MDISEYTRLNESFGRICTFRIGKGAGFFSEYNNMILAMAYCLIHHICFQITSEKANFNQQKGWTGFFLPFCKEIKDDGKHYLTENWKSALKNIVFRQHWESFSSLFPYLWPWKTQMRTQDVFGKCRDRNLENRTYEIPSIGFRGSLLQLCTQLVGMTWNYNEMTQKRIDTLITSLDLPDEYVAIHVRRGDKSVEIQHTPIQRYMEKLDGQFRNLFVASDDYSVIEEVRKLYPDRHIWTLCTPNERGYDQSKSDKETLEEKERNMITLFATMEVLNKATRFVGTYSSNIGMFMGMRNPEICSAVDFDQWLIW